MNKIKIFLILPLIGCLSILNAQPSYIWGKQFGTSDPDHSWFITGDNNDNIIVSGSTMGDLFSENLGDYDGIVAKYDSIGNIIWQEQFGTNMWDQVWSMDIDTKGNIYLAGATTGTIEGIHYGDYDIFLYKYDKNGILLNQKIFGTTQEDWVYSICVDDSNNIFLSGYTEGDFGYQNSGGKDCFLIKLDSNCSEIFTIVFGTENEDLCFNQFIDDSSNIYLAGMTEGNLGQENLGNYDAFVAKFSGQGEQLWIKQFGTQQWDAASKVLIDKEYNIYITGATSGNLADQNQGNDDVFLRKLDKNGNILWETQFGTSNMDQVNDLGFADSDSSDIIISGSIDGFKSGFFRKYDTDGSLLWNQYFGPNDISNGPRVYDHFISSKNQIYLTGNAFNSNLFSDSKGNYDAFITRFSLDSTPECPLTIRYPVNDTIIDGNKEFQFVLPVNYIESVIENDTLIYDVKIKGVNHFATWMEPNSTTFLFDGDSEIAGIYNDSTYHDIHLASSELPSWLNFNNTTLEFSGTPVKNEELEIVIIIKNTIKYVIKDVFKITIEGITDIPEIKGNNGIVIYPNPVKNEIHFSNLNTNEITFYQLINVEGKVAKQGRLNSEIIKTTSLDSGMYILLLNSSNELISKKIMID